MSSRTLENVSSLIPGYRVSHLRRTEIFKPIFVFLIYFSLFPAFYNSKRQSGLWLSIEKCILHTRSIYNMCTEALFCTVWCGMPGDNQRVWCGILKHHFWYFFKITSVNSLLMYI